MRVRATLALGSAAAGPEAEDAGGARHAYTEQQANH